MLHGDFGRSALTNSTVTSQLGEKLDRHRPAGDRLDDPVVVRRRAARRLRRRAPTARPTGWRSRRVGQLGIAIPQFLVGIGLIAVFAGHFGLPVAGLPAQRVERRLRARRPVARPADPHPRRGPGRGALRFVRSATLDVLHQDYIRTARAKGLTRTRALFAHGLRNASIPIVSVLGVQMASLIAGVVVIERVFNLPGVGQMLVKDVGNRDFDKVQGTILLIAVIVLVIGFLVDLTHYLIDPRLRVRA